LGYGRAPRRMTVWREVADRVWIRHYEPLDQTIGAIADPDGEPLCVIDTRASHRLADELRAQLGQLPGRVAAVVNTHGHWDHVFGNARFRDAPNRGGDRARATGDRLSKIAHVVE